ncbi:MAG: porphobilinogen synthase [Nitrososphaerota archaeon]
MLKRIAERRGRARPMRLRRTAQIREMIRETELSVNDLIYPVFVKEALVGREKIPSMPGIYRLSLDELVVEASRAKRLGIPGILVFGIPSSKDELGSSAYRADGIVQKAVRAVKENVGDLLVATDVCLCQYTIHGHCGVIKEGRVANDESIEILARIAVSHAEAGVDVVAPSAMMDHQVLAIREGLDKAGFTDVAIMSYSAKYASALYGPFREAAYSSPSFGDRSSYQMDPSNIREAMREIELDLREGADIVMVKPALAYLDVIVRARSKFNVPIAAYSVSGEYSMIKAVAEKGWIDEKRVVMEFLTSIKRAGADIIITYFAPQVAGWLKA